MPNLVPGARDPKSTATSSSISELAAQSSKEGQTRKKGDYNTGWQLLP